MDAISRLKNRLSKDRPPSTSKAGTSSSQDPSKTPTASIASVGPPAAQPAAQRETRPISQAVPQAAAQPARQLAVRSAAQPTTQGTGRSSTQPWYKQASSPRNGVQVAIHHHPLYRAAGTDFAPGSPEKVPHLWTYITTNLKAIAGGELVMSVKCRPNEAPELYPRDFLDICDSVYQQAKAQYPVLRRWRVLRLDEAVFSRPDWRAVVLAFRNSPIYGLGSVEIENSPVPHFYCLPLSDNEATAIQLHGMVRVLCRHENEWFPFAPSVDRDRDSTVNLNLMKTSLLASGSFNRLEVTGLNVIQRESFGQVTLHVPADRVEWFKVAMMSKRDNAVNSLLILPDLHDLCERLYLWNPRLPAKIRSLNKSPTQYIAANFLIISFNQATEAIQATEDGILVLLGPGNTARFFDAATNEQSLSLNLGGTIFELSWPPSWDTSPVSKVSHTAASAFQPDGDPNDRPVDPEHIKVEGIALLREPRPGHISVKAFADFHRTAEKALMEVIPPQKPGLLPRGCGIVAQFRLPKVDSRSFGVVLLAPPETERMIMRSDDPLGDNEVQDLINNLGRVMGGLQVPDGIVYGDWVEWETTFWCWGCDPNSV